MTVTLLKTKGDFDEFLTRNADKLVVVDFYATWCAPCKAIAPAIEAMAAELIDVVFAKVDVDENADTAEAENVTAMPTFNLYKNRQKVDELIGASEKDLRGKIAKHC